MKDGWSDCLERKDELDPTSTEIERSCARVQRHRFRCSPEQGTCISVASLGSSTIDCRNDFDYRWFGSGRTLSSMNCNERWKDDCFTLRQYIDQSWSSISMNKSEVTSEDLISFHFYCDTFWDLRSRDDENLRECQSEWICAEDQWRCPSGQCLPEHWENDKEWDCPDASDEPYFITIFSRDTLERAAFYDFSNRSFLIPSSCPQSDPFLCPSANATRQGFSCFILSQIGDGHIDCAGAFDEQMLVEHCSHSSTLGLDYLCASSETCIPYFLHCSSTHRCPNRSDDQFWCERQHQPSDCTDLNDFVCFNGECVKGLRCNELADFPLGEDEHICDRPSASDGTLVQFRQVKRLSRRIATNTVRLSPYPADAKIGEVVSDSLSIVLLWEIFLPIVRHCLRIGAIEVSGF